MSIGRIELVDGKKQYVRYATMGGSGGETGGVQVGNVKDLSINESTDNLTLKWKDPDNVVFNGELIAEWAGTKVVRKEGGNPENVEDGTLIAESTVKDQYAVDGLQDSDVVVDTQYNYALFPYTTKNIYTRSDLNRVRGSLMEYNPILSENTWKIIHGASALGIAKNLWKIGDEKDGFRIIDFDHDDLSDGSGKAGITFDVISSKYTTKSKYASTNTGYVNYPQSVLKDTLETTIWDLLPEDLKEYMKPVDKAASMSYSNSYRFGVTNISCKLFPFSLVEIFGAATVSTGEYSTVAVGGSQKYTLEGTKYEGINKWFYLDGKKVMGTTRTYACSSSSDKDMFYYTTDTYDIYKGSGYVTREHDVRYGFCI